MFETAICAIYKNETKHLNEWIVYHSLIGIEHFYLYCNDADLKSVSVLQKHIDAGLVTVAHVLSPPKRTLQTSVYNRCIGECNAKWLAIIDIDEFIFPMISDNLSDILANFDKNDIAALAMNWCIFGTSNRIDSPELQTRDLVNRSEINFQPNSHVKLIMRPDRCVGMTINPHTAIYRTGIAVNENYGLVRQYFNLPITWDKIRLNHYVLRSAEDYKIKQARGKTCASGSYTQEFFNAHDRNEVFDDSIWARFGQRILDKL